MALNQTSCAAFNTTVVIGDAVRVPGGSNDVPPSLTEVLIGGVSTPIKAALELKSSLGPLVIPRMNNAQEAAMGVAADVVDGSIIYNTQLQTFRLRQNNNWTNAAAAGGDIVGPGVSTIN